MYQLNGNILKVPNRDDISNGYVIRKETIQKAYKEAEGTKRFVCGQERYIRSVDVTNDYIIITLD